MIQLPQWTLEQLVEDAATSEANFRSERLDEPLERYSSFFDKFANIFSDLVDELNAFALEHDPEVLPQIMRDGSRSTALRYTTAPPISEDDLATLAETKLSATALRNDPEAARRVREVLLHILDQHRFPWVKEQRSPTPEEKQIAVIASAALVAAQKLATERRGQGKALERTVTEIIEKADFKPEKRKPIVLPDDVPSVGHYYGEITIGAARADATVRLLDRRTLAIECKSSNSAVNSHKRIFKETATSAKEWRNTLGRSVLPCAVISGVFSPTTLYNVQQEAGLSLIWAHRLEDLDEFLRAAR